MTKISRVAAVLLCAGGLAAAAPEAAAAQPAPEAAAARPAPAASAASAAEPPAHCLAGVHRAQVTCLPAVTSRLCAVQYAWIPFTTSGAAPCLTNGVFAS